MALDEALWLSGGPVWGFGVEDLQGDWMVTQVRVSYDMCIHALVKNYC